MDKIKLYRKRYIPNEVVLLKDDVPLYMDKDVIITKWGILKPRKDFNNGYSCYFLNKNIKVSKFFLNDKFIYTYCDIIETVYDKGENAYWFNDLLADVIIYENGLVKVMDLGEITDALEMGLINLSQVKTALNALDGLLRVIYGGNLGNLTKMLDEFIDK
jgi:predicted RNA-binding protein associated with RNAse of E/G family